MRRGCERVALGALTALCAMASAGTALAQDALLIGGRFYSASRNPGQDLGPGPIVAQENIFAGGRYALIADGVIDGHSGAILPIHGNVLATDRARPRIFVPRDSGLWMVDVSSGAETLVWLGDATLIHRCSHAYSANVLFCGVQRPDGLTDVLAIDVATTVARIIAAVDVRPRGSFSVPAWLVTSDGRRLYFGQGSDPLADLHLAVLHTDSGVVTPSTAPGDAGTDRPAVILDEVNERVIVFGAPGVILLSKDLELLATATLGGALGLRGRTYALECTNLAISPHTGRLYLGLSFRSDGFIAPAMLGVFDSAGYASLAPPATFIPPISKAPCPNMAVLAAPGAPRDLSGLVLGSQVALSWTNIGGASGFVLDVGMAPGRTDLSVHLGPDTWATFPGVPSGTYYVRVRGRNEFGVGRPSSEFKLLVP
jgi:hypothetical protein